MIHEPPYINGDGYYEESEEEIEYYRSFEIDRNEWNKIDKIMGLI